MPHKKKIKVRVAYSAEEAPERPTVDKMNRLEELIIDAAPGAEIFKRSREMRQMLAWARDMLHLQAELLTSLRAQVRAAENDVDFANSGTPWTPQEDAFLVQERADGRGILTLSIGLARSPGSVATRLSELVGIPRRTMRIEGKRIEGNLEGLEVSGRFVGTLINDKS